MKKSQYFSAVDIGSSKIVTLIAVSSPEENKLRVVGVSSVPSRGVRKSQIVDIEEVIEAVTESVEAAERMAGFAISEAFVSISGIHIESTNSHGLIAVQNPEGEISSDDVRRVIEAARAVPLDASREILHVIPRFFTLDNQEGIKDPVGMSGIRLEVDAHIITASTTNLKNLTKVISEIGVDTQGVVFSGLASAESTLTSTEKELGVVLVDIGGGTTSLCVYHEGALAHSAVIPVGARNITNDIAIGLRVKIETAERIKHFLTPTEQPSRALDPKNPASHKQKDEIDLYKLGIKDGPRKISRKTVFDGIVRPRLNEMMQLIYKEIQKSGFLGKTPAGVVFTGGGALTYGLEFAARRNLGLPSRIAYPKKLSGLVDELNSPEFATVIGLLLYSLDNQVSSHSSFSLPFTSFKFNMQQPIKKLINFVKSFLP